MTRIYKTEGVENDILMADKIGEMSAFELLFILARFVGSIYVFYIISKKPRHVLTKPTITSYFCYLCICVYVCYYTMKSSFFRKDFLCF
jgi:hypothetical protein